MGHFSGAIPAFKGLPFLGNTIGVPVSPFREALTKGMGRDDMLPFQTVSSLAFLLGGRIVTGEDLFFRIERTPTIKRGPMIPGDISLQGFLGSIERIVCGIGSVPSLAGENENGRRKPEG